MATGCEEQRGLMRELAADSLSKDAEVAMQTSSDVHRRRRRRWPALAAALGLAASTCGFALSRRQAWGEARCVEEGFEAAVETERDFIRLVAEHGQGALGQYLQAATAAGDTFEEADDRALSVEARKAIQEAMALGADSPEEARKIVNQAMAGSVARSKARRKKVFQSLKGQRRGLRVAGKMTKSEQAQQATCVFRSLYAANVLAQAAADINDATRTCYGVNASNAWAKGNTHGKMCVVNAVSALVDFVNLAAIVSSVANDCAATLIPNMDQLCSAAAAGLVTAIAQLAGSGNFIAAACRPGKSVIFQHVPPGAVPSNVGSNEDRFNYPPYSNTQDIRRLSEDAPARRLVFGGGKGSLATQCYLDVSNTAWYLAQAGLAISQVSKHTGFGGCPGGNLLNGQKVKGKIWEWRTAYCVSDAFGVITFFAAAVAYMQLTAVHCTDVLNLKAVCGAGIDGILASLSAIVQTSIGVHVSCKEFQRPELKRLLEVITRLDNSADNSISSMVDVIRPGRRLGVRQGPAEAEGEDPIDKLKREYGTPEEVWRSLGYDLNDPEAEFRKTKAVLPSDDDVIQLLARQREDEESKKLLGLSSRFTACGGGRA